HARSGGLAVPAAPGFSGLPVPPLVGIRRRRPRGRISAPIIGVLFALLLFTPALAVLSAGALEGGLSGWLHEAADMFARAGTWRSLRFSAAQAAASAAISVVIAFPGSYYLAHVRFPGRRIVQSLTLVPFVLPSLIVILAVISFYGRAGIINQLFGTSVAAVYSPAGIIIAHVIFNVAVALRVLAGGWLTIDERLREASRSLGENTSQRLRHLYVPLLAPHGAVAAIIIFLYCFVSFAVVLIFGGVQYATLEVRIYREMFVNLNLSGAGVLAALQLVAAAVVVFGLEKIGARRAASPGRDRRIHVYEWAKLPGRSRALCLGYWVALAVVFGGPLVTFVAGAFFSGGAFSLEAFSALIEGHIGNRNLESIMRASFFEIAGTSLLLATATGITTTLVAFISARILRGVRVPWLDTLSTMPLAVSSVTYSLGLYVLFARTVDPFALILLTQSVMGFPLVFRSMRATVNSFPPGYTESAMSLGAGFWFRLRTIELPVLGRGLVNAFAFAFALSLADFTSVLTIGRGAVVTFPVAMYRLIGFQSFDVALALGVWYIALVALTFLVIDRTSLSSEGLGL
ncbi:MAG: ABC transporter permease, partial [bacterium]